MKVPAITGERSVEIRDVPEPEPVDDWVKVRVDVAPMCTEYKQYRDGYEDASLGHEAAGEIVGVDGDRDVDAGDRVVLMPLHSCGTCSLCRNGEYIYCENAVDFEEETGYRHGNAAFGQYVLKPDRLCVPIPDGLSTERASMACCGLGPTFGACERLDVGPDDTLLVSGAGPVGLGGVINGTYRGARVIVTEPTAYRADLARELGADAVIDPSEDGRARIDELTDGTGVDGAIECTGLPEAQRFALDALKRRGELAFVGEGEELTIDTSGDMLRKGITLHGCWHYNRSRVWDLLSIIESVPEKLDAMITHEFPLDDVEAAFERQAERKTGKVLLRPWQ